MAKLVNNKWVFTEAEISEQIARGKKLYEKQTEKRPVAIRFTFDSVKRILSVRAADGARIDVPVAKIKELRNADSKAIRGGYITAEGDAVHWDDLDAHYTITGLAANVFGTKEWMREIAKIGGSKTSPAKTAAARLNGQKGGRPKRTFKISAP